MHLLARIAVPVAIVLVFSSCSVRPPIAPSVPDLSAPRRHVFSNGVTVIAQEHRGAPVVAVQLWVRAGARDETATELGLAHYLEHMLFKGTPTRAPGFVDRDIERVGGRMNAATSQDYTYYHAVLPADRAVPTIRMLSDIAVNATLDETLLDNEKRIVFEEMRLHEDNPRRFLSQRLWALAFPKHPYGRPVIGTPELIRSLTSDTLRRFYRRHYVPHSFTLVVVGDVNADQILTAVTDAFGRLPRAGEARRATAPPSALSERLDQVTRPGAHAYLGLAWHAPRVYHTDTAAMSLLVGILGQSRTSRLTLTLRDRLGLVQTISSGYTAMEAGGLVTVTAQLDPAQLTRVESEILREVERLRDHGVTEEERRRAVTAAEAGHEFSLETAEGRAFALGRAETMWSIEAELAWVDRLRSVTPVEVRSVARRYLVPGAHVRLAVVPPR